MNNFFEKVLALRNRYYDNAVKLRLEHYGPNYANETTDPCKDCEIEMLSQFVATYIMYGENIPNKFTIKLSNYHNIDYISFILQSIFYDLSIEYKIKSVSPALSRNNCNPYAGAYAYNITLLK